jgi:Tfp pilus assembly protein PilO
MKKLSKEKRDRLILIALATVIVITGTYYGIISAQKRALANIAEASRDQGNKVGNAQRLVKATAQVREQLEMDIAQLEAVEKTMASGDMYSWIFNTLNEFRANRSVDIPQFSREVSTEVGLLPQFPYKAVLFNVRGTAFYHDLGKFIANFEAAFPFMRVQNLELEPAASTAATSLTTTPPATGNDFEKHAAEKLAFKMEIIALVNPNAR